MKNKIFLALTMAALLVSCNQKIKVTETDNTQMMENDSTMMKNDSTMMKNDGTMTNDETKMPDADSKTYACPMHTEVQGKLNDKCPKCGMKLTELVTENSDTNNK